MSYWRKRTYTDVDRADARRLSDRIGTAPDWREAGYLHRIDALRALAGDGVSDAVMAALVDETIDRLPLEAKMTTTVELVDIFPIVDGGDA